MKSKHKNSVHLVGFYTYCKMRHGAYNVKLIWNFLSRNDYLKADAECRLKILHQSVVFRNVFMLLFENDIVVFARICQLRTPAALYPSNRVPGTLFFLVSRIGP